MTERKLTLAQSLALAIKKEETGSDPMQTGYQQDEDAPVYYTYMTKDEWETFRSNMHSSDADDFNKGQGKELEAKGSQPPKMACYGSSSRMLYVTVREKIKPGGIPTVKFEKKLSTTVGGTANFDGYTDNGMEHVFIEAKCQEIYGSKSYISKSYLCIYEYLRKIKGFDFSVGKEKLKKSGNKVYESAEISFYINGKPVLYLDLKQILCHLMGISTGVINGEYRDKPIKFIYFMYNPEQLDFFENKKQIVEIYRQTINEWNMLKGIIKEIFRELLEYFGTRIDKEDYDMSWIAGIANGFSCVLCDRTEFIKELGL